MAKTARDRVGVTLSHEPCKRAADGDTDRQYSEFEAKRQPVKVAQACSLKPSKPTK